MLIKFFFILVIFCITISYKGQKHPNYEFLNTNYEFLNTILPSNYEFLNTIFLICGIFGVFSFFYSFYYVCKKSILWQSKTRSLFRVTF